MVSSIVLTVVDGVVAAFLTGVVMSLGPSALVAMAIILVPISRRLRTRMNELMDEIQLKG